MIKNLLLTPIVILFSISLSAQCTDYASPEPPAAYIDIGAVPCNGESLEMTDFQIYKSEAYILGDIKAGANYTFSICGGSAAGTWVPDFTLIAPSGAVDAFGAGDGDGCSITWTATESGAYKVLINEAGNCGVGGELENGSPKIMTNSGGRACPEFLDGAESFESEDGSLPDCWKAIDADGDGFNWVILNGDSAGLDGDHVIGSYSYDNTAGTLTPDNYLITPQVTLGENDSLYYAVKVIDFQFSSEVYSVMVSTTGTEPADFTEVFADTLTYFYNWSSRSVDLSAYANQTVYLAFRHHGSSDVYGFIIDGVKLPGTVNCEPTAVNELNEVETSIFPNPVTEKLNITSSLEGVANIRIFDALGRIVLEDVVNISNTTITQNVSSLESGMYTIQISTSDKVATNHFLKQ